MGEQYTPVQTKTVTAAGTISANRFLTPGGAYPSAAAKAYGIGLTDGVLNDRVPVVTVGTAIGTAGAAITAGAEVEVGSNGKAVTLAAGKSVGMALEDASADGDLLEIKVY